MTTHSIHPRYSGNLLRVALTDTPVVLIHGPRQCGKTTLTQTIGDKLGYHYITFDDNAQLQAAKTDPIGFVHGLPDKVILDEVQRTPELFASIKMSVDQNRRPGRFILTGSANVLLLPKLSDSLAGRMEIIQLRPLSRLEIADKKPTFLAQLFQGSFNDRANRRASPRLHRSLADIIASGGYPAALTRHTEKRRSAWYRDYVHTLLQRDARDISRIQNLDLLPKLLTLTAGQTARLFTAADYAAPLALSRPTISQYLALLEQIFLIEQVQPWHSNRLSRLIKTPKMHLADTGLACALLGVTAKTLWEDKALLGQMLETFIYQELRKQADWFDEPLELFHFRNKDKVEVDIVIQRGRDLAGIEVKAAATVTAKDFQGLNKLKAACGAQFIAGVLLYDGEHCLSFGEKLFAVPISLLSPKS